jgi:hypothetical protein
VIIQAQNTKQDIGLVELGKIMSHLRETNMGYWEHWWRAMKCSLALFIHAWYPNILEDYASKELQND